MKVKDIMTRKIDFVTADFTLQQTAEKMKEMDVGEFPILMGDEAVGIVTDRDIVIRGVAHGHDPKVGKVVEAMTEGIISCKEDDAIEEAARIMASHKIRRLPVMDTNGKMSGIISLGDLAQNIDKSRVGEMLMEISR